MRGRLVARLSNLQDYSELLLIKNELHLDLNQRNLEVRREQLLMPKQNQIGGAKNGLSTRTGEGEIGQET